MRDTAALSADDCEILVVRELRRAGIEPAALRRPKKSLTPDGGGWRFDLVGRLEAYGRRWSAFVACRNTGGSMTADAVEDVRRGAENAGARSALLFTTSPFDLSAIERAHEQRIALFEIVEAHPVLLAAGLIQPGPLPSWVPELTVELIALEDGGVRRRLLEADQPEIILRQLRRSGYDVV